MLYGQLVTGPMSSGRPTSAAVLQHLTWRFNMPSARCGGLAPANRTALPLVLSMFQKNRHVPPRRTCMTQASSTVATWSCSHQHANSGSTSVRLVTLHITPSSTWRASRLARSQCWCRCACLQLHVEQGRFMCGGMVRGGSSIPVQGGQTCNCHTRRQSQCSCRRKSHSARELHMESRIALTYNTVQQSLTLSSEYAPPGL